MKEINNIDNTAALKAFKNGLETRSDYKILATGQGLITKMFDLQTSSLKRLKNIIDEKEKTLSTNDSAEESQTKFPK